MKYKTPMTMALVFGTVHFLVVGIPFIKAGGGGERLLYIVLVDYPLFWLANLLAPKPLYTSVAFNFWLFPIMGTIMYAAVGYLLGQGIVYLKKRRRGVRSLG